MGSTPAGELARIKVQHPGWSIRQGWPGNGTVFIARRTLIDGRLRQVRARSLATLEHKLWVLDKFRHD
jgi:hypothetical protein